MAGWTRVAGTSLGVTLLLMAGAAGYVRSLLWFPEDIEQVEVSCDASAGELPKGKVLTALVWNVQFAGSRKHHFFYDGGEAVHVPVEDVEDMLEQMTRVVKKLDPDVILWQELDRDSDRTGHIDQVARLVQSTAYPCHAAASYHKVGYVPTPSHDHMGQVDLNLAVFSKYAIRSATRHQLSLMDEPTWRQWFNLRRAMLDVRVKVEGGGEMALLDTHLSAFSNNDGTLFKQVDQLHDHATTLEKAGVPWLLGGDFNALPPGEDPNRLGPEALAAYGPVTPMTQLYDRFTPVFPAKDLASNPQPFRTYVPFGELTPDRTIDYGFVGREVILHGTEVLQELGISDHLPIAVRFSIGPVAEEAVVPAEPVAPAPDADGVEDLGEPPAIEEGNP